MPMHPPRFHVRAFVLATAAASLLLAAMILAGVSHARSGEDQNLFHLKVIERFSTEFPAFGLSNYPSATTPGYHILIAAVHRFITADLLLLRLLSTLPTAALFGTLVGMLAARRPTAEAVCLALPLLACPYILQSGMYLLPDNLAWLLVLVVIAVALAPVQSWRRWAVAGTLLVLLVGVRQIHIWAAAAVWAGAWFAAPVIGDLPSARWLSALRNQELPATADPAAEAELSGAAVLADVPHSLRRTGLALLLTLPAFAVLGVFVALWGGLTPAAFRDAHQTLGVDGGPTVPTNVVGLSPATPAFMLALLAIYISFCLPLTWPTLRLLLARKWFRIGLGLAVTLGALLALVPETTYALRPHPLRIGGLWNAVKFLQDRGLTLLGRTSPLIVLMAAAGAGGVFALLVGAQRQARWVLAATLVGFMAAGSAQALSWQRYFEPLLLIWVALAVASREVPAVRAGNDGANRPNVPAWPALAGPLVLAGLMAALSVAAFAGKFG